MRDCVWGLGGCFGIGRGGFGLVRGGFGFVCDELWGMILGVGGWDRVVQGGFAGWWVAFLGLGACVVASGVGFGGWGVVLDLGGSVLGSRGVVMGLGVMVLGDMFLWGWGGTGWVR